MKKTIISKWNTKPTEVTITKVVRDDGSIYYIKQSKEIK
jgi:hypothetical protein